ncbi:MAG: hypothetical protein FH761_12410 [Firmicutes bacterium]|nr:hypothetical protein [Bacillota bacterium]
MNRKKVSRFLLVMLMVCTTLQIGAISYSSAAKQLNGSINETSENQKIEDIEISQEILNFIKDVDPGDYGTNVTNYKKALIELGIQPRFKSEIERLIKEGHSLPDLLIAYEFLYNNFGKMEELEILSNKKQSGKSWSKIFATYQSENGEFIPNSFDPQYLQDLMREEYITPDDIMIADRIAYKLGLEHKDIISYRFDGIEWKKINEDLGILNSQSELPRVKVTEEQLDKLTNQYNLSEEEIIEALVIAERIDKDSKEIIEKIKSGYSEVEILAECYQEKYY